MAKTKLMAALEAAAARGPLTLESLAEVAIGTPRGSIVDLIQFLIDSGYTLATKTEQPSPSHPPTADPAKRHAVCLAGTDWINPLPIGQACPVCGQVHFCGAETLRCYRRLMIARLRGEQTADVVHIYRQAGVSAVKVRPWRKFRYDLAGLKGWTMTCHEHADGDANCHVPFLLRLAAWAADNPLPPAATTPVQAAQTV